MCESGAFILLIGFQYAEIEQERKRQRVRENANSLNLKTEGNPHIIVKRRILFCQL